MAKRDGIRHASATSIALDVIDLRILRILGEDYSVSYQKLGDRIHLSAAATHERVKRLKREGVILKTVALLDGCKLGRTLLTFLLVDTNALESTRELLTVSNRPEVEEFHTVAGDSSVIIKVRVPNTECLEQYLMDIQQVKGVRAVRSYIVLSTFQEHGPIPSPEARE